MDNPIEGKVARILNSRQLILNVGSNKGVQLGMCFAVLDEGGEDVTDPDSNEVLGSISIHKVLVCIVRVEEKMSIASTFRFKKETKRGGGLGLTGRELAYLFEPTRTIRNYETLEKKNFGRDKISILDEKDSYVSVGDIVIQVEKPKSNEIESIF